MDLIANYLQHLPLRLAGNQVVVNIESVPDDVLTTAGVSRGALAYQLELYLPQAYHSGTFEKVLTKEGAESPAVSFAGLPFRPGASFDIADDLNAYLTRTPPTLSSTPFPCPDLVRPFRVKTKIAPLNLATSLPDEYALKGRLSVNQFANWRDGFFTDFFNDRRPFLTWQPNPKVVQRSQPEFLYFLVNFTPKPTRLDLRCRLEFEDGSTQNFTAYSLTAPSQYAVYGLPVGFESLGLPARETTAGKLAVRYSVWLNNELGDTVSERRAYQLDRRHRRNVRYLLFANSLGGFDTLACTGVATEGLTVRQSLGSRALDEAYLPSAAELFVTGTDADRDLTLATGYFDGAQSEYLDELMLSEEIYVLTQEGLIPLIRTSNQHVTAQDDEFLAGRTFAFRQAKTEVGFSALPAAPPAPARPLMWVPEGQYCLIDAETGKRTGRMGASKLRLYWGDTLEAVKGVAPKLNVPGTEGYTAPIDAAQCGVATTPYLNVAIVREASFARNNCGSGFEGTKPTISIAAGAYGSETSQAEAQARAEQAYALLNTQAYANANGTCQVQTAPQFYTMMGIASGRINFRFAPGLLPTAFVAGGPAMDSGLNTDEVHTNGWGGSSNTNPSSTILPPGTNDCKLPVAFTTGTFAYRVHFGGATGTFRAYVNGTQVYSEVLANFSGYVRPTWGAVASGDRLYVELIA